MTKKKRDLLTVAYEKSGEMFRNSVFGRLVKYTITNDFTKTQRDKFLNQYPEHYKRFAQFLSGGTVGNKEITWLPDHIKKDIIDAHKMENYPRREEILKGGSTKGQPNPKYDPKSTLLSTWMPKNPSVETTYSLGHVQFKPTKDGGYRMTDTYDVDPNKELGNDEPYKPLRGVKSDLVEGDQMASRLYDASTWLGITQPLKYNVKFNRKDLQINK